VGLDAAGVLFILWGVSAIRRRMGVRRLGLYDLRFRMGETESSRNIEILNVDNRLRGRRTVF